MKHLKLILVVNLILITVQVQESQAKSYRGFVLLRVKPETKQQVQSLIKLEKKGEEDIDFWNDIREPGKPVDIMIAPKLKKKFLASLVTLKIGYEILQKDFQSVIDGEKRRLMKKKFRSRSFKPDNVEQFDFEEYNDFSEIHKLMKNLVSKYPNTTELVEYGQTREGRPLLVLRISGNQTKKGASKPVLFLEAGIHAREWLSHATALWIMNKLVNGNSTEYEDVLSEIDIYIAPVTNPDGYAFTWAPNGARLWRKNRSAKVKGANGNECAGVDLNRNWDFYFGLGGKTQYASGPCTEQYPGETAFSELETSSLADFLTKKLGSNLKAYISLHAYGQLLLYPFGLPDKLPDASVIFMANKMVEALEGAHKTRYHQMPIYEIYEHENTTGTTVDWVAAKIGTTYSYCIELRPKSPRKPATHGFVEPPEAIKPTGEEVWAAILVLAKQVIKENKIEFGSA